MGEASFFSKQKYFSYALISIFVELLVHIARPFARASIADFSILIPFLFIPFIVRFVWFCFIAYDSKILKTIYGYLLIISFAAFGLGLLAKLEHWWWAAYALIAGSISALIIYTIRFFLKSKKNLLDYAKYVFVLFYFGISFLILERFISADFKLVYHILFYALVFMFALVKDLTYKLEDESFSFEKV